MAKKFISKASSSNQDPHSTHRKVRSASVAPPQRQQPHQQPRFPLSHSENNLHRIFGNSGVSLAPAGRVNHELQPRSESPESQLTVYKTKVMYHSRADFRSSSDESTSTQEAQVWPKNLANNIAKLASSRVARNVAHKP